MSKKSLTPKFDSVNSYGDFNNCPNCDGTGTCDTCDGTGFAHDGFGMLGECYDCNGGSGECQTCDGTGHVTAETYEDYINRITRDHLSSDAYGSDENRV